MKKRINILMIIMLCSFLCSCNKNISTDSYIFNVDTENESDYILEILQIDNQNIDNILCVQDGNIIYSRYEKEDTILAFYKYSISENLTYNIGNIENPYINSGDVVVVKDIIFFYCNEVIIDSRNPNGKLENTLYKIDIVNNSLQKVASDDVEQTLIYLNELDDKIISFKGITDENESITYLDSFDISEENSNNFDVLFSKEYNKETGSGEIIYNFSVYESTIYAIICTKNSSNDAIWTIEKYDSDGTYIDSLMIDREIADLLKGERISKFEICGEYGFIRTFSGSGVLFAISSNEIVPWLLSKTDLDIASFVSNENAHYVILYSRDTGDIWRLDIVNNSLCKLDLNYEYLKYIFVDNNKILISSDDTIYGELDKLPVENDNLLMR